MVLQAFTHPDEGLKELLLDGFERLSPTSRTMRFFSGKPRLTSAELDYLTDLDGTRHLAIGAVEDGPDGPRGLGVARFVRLEGHPEVAEPAVTVVDDAQGLGLGTLLMDRLVQAARERGIERFRAEFLSTNVAVQRLLLDVVPETTFHTDPTDEVTIAELPLDPSQGQPDHPTPVIDLIRRVLKHHVGAS